MKKTQRVVLEEDDHHDGSSSVDTATFLSTTSSIMDAELAASTSNYVYIKSDEHAWVPARVLQQNDGKAVVSVPLYKDEQAIQSDGGRTARRNDKVTVKLADYPNSALLLQNVDENGLLKEVEDMVDLPFLHEAAILYNLKTRHIHEKPYTRTGDIVIACNPYQWYDGLYSEEKRRYYAKALVWDTVEHGDPRANLQPHVYETSSLAYRGLAVEGDDQSILVSGESGAGKTETVKILLSHLASVQRGVNCTTITATEYEESPIVQRVLDSNPLLEAFGNAKTVRNDNSSRFGKFVQLQFDAEDPIAAAYAGKVVPSCVLAGSKCEVYLLEKSRVVSHEEEERTYHIFYQLLAADEQVKTQFWEGLADTDNESFSYVGFTETDTIEGMTDRERFEQTVKSLALVGIEGDKLRTLMRAICIVLQLGNLIFKPHQADESRSIIESDEDFTALSDLMGIAKEELLAALTIRTMTARNETFKVPLNSIQARDSCDAFAKEIYAKTFLWLVRTINDATCAERNYDGVNKTDFGLIGMLDIFGFEVFETNRFEQLCINYANEKLQQKFTQDIFRSVQAEYEFEGIELGEITYDDNTDVLDLVEGRMGLLAFLNEECVRPGGSDKGFVSKARTMNKDSPCFVSEHSFTEVQFGVRHYAGKVIYDAFGFVTKNMDTLPSDLQDCAAKSTNTILANELSNDAMMNEAPSPAKKRRSPVAKSRTPAKTNPKDTPKKKGSNLIGETVWTKFKNQLSDLMGTLQKTRTRYIRCIKPNQDKLPRVMQHQTTVEQLRCAGVVAAVTISRSAFPNRLEHCIVLDRFKSLWRRGDHTPLDDEVLNDESEDSTVRQRFLVDSLLTKALESLQVERDDGKIVKAFVIGKTRAYFRAGALEFLESERLKGLSVWATVIQQAIRRFVASAKYAKMRWVSIRIQSEARRRAVRARYCRAKSAAIMLECWYRCILAQRTLVLLNRNHNATKIQTHWRMAVAITVLKAQRTAAIKVQAIARGAIQRPKFRAALHERREEAKLENQVLALQRKLEEAEARRVEAEKLAEENARKALETSFEEKKETATVKEEPVVAPPSPSTAAKSAKTTAQMTAQQQTLMDESGKMLEYLRKEVFKLRNQNAQLRRDFDLLKDNNQRLMDANASAGASFGALNQHAKQLARTNEKLAADLSNAKQQVQKLNVTQIELKEELKMKQATYVAEVQSRLQYQKALTAIVDLLQERCRDTRLVEDALELADACEQEYMTGPNSMRPTAAPSTPQRKNNDTGLMSSFRSLWS